MCGGPPCGETYQSLIYRASCRDLHDEDPDEEPIRRLSAKEKDEFRQLAKGNRWTRYWIGISSTEEQVILGGYTDYGSFRTRDGKGKFHLWTNFHYGNVPNNERYGIGAHRACATLLEQELGYSLRFADLFHRTSHYNFVAGIPYDEMGEWSGEGGDLFWRLRNPLEDLDNRRRILRMWRPFVRSLREKAAKKKAKRPARAKVAVVVPKAKARPSGKKGKAR